MFTTQRNVCSRSVYNHVCCLAERKGCNCVATKKENVSITATHDSVVLAVCALLKRCSENSVVLEVSLCTYSTVRLQRVAQRVYCTVSQWSQMDNMTIVVEERKGCDCVATKKEKVLYRHATIQLSFQKMFGEFSRTWRKQRFLLTALRVRAQMCAHLFGSLLVLAPFPSIFAGSLQEARFWKGISTI